MLSGFHIHLQHGLIRANQLSGDVSVLQPVSVKLNQRPGSALLIDNIWVMFVEEPRFRLFHRTRNKRLDFLKQRTGDYKSQFLTH